jgi:hypothetical protein
MSFGAKHKIGAEEAPVVSDKVHNWNTASIRAALAILADRKKLGQLKYYAEASSDSDGDELIHRALIEVVYRTKREK